MVVTSNRTVLYVTGFTTHLRARDLAYEFERYGRLVRCDIPALKSSQASPHTKAFAFIEFRREDDAEDAYYDMHGRAIEGKRITVQWAKRPPSVAWRHDGGVPGSDRGPRANGRDGRGKSDLRRGEWPDDIRRDAPRRRSPTPPPRGYRSPPRRDASPARRDRSPVRSDRGRDVSPRRSYGGRGRSASPRQDRGDARRRSPSPRRDEGQRRDDYDGPSNGNRHRGASPSARGESGNGDGARENDGEIRMRSPSPAGEVVNE